MSDDFIISELRRIREQKGVSREKIANQLGLSLSLIKRYENGENDPSFKTVCRWTDALGHDLAVNDRMPTKSIQTRTRNAMDYDFLISDLRRIRMERRMTQADAAQAAGVTLRVFQYWEGGESEPGAKNLIRWIEALGYDFDIFLSESKLRKAG